jgi:tRNA threonylcarbamoyladenosine dehydratase
MSTGFYEGLTERNRGLIPDPVQKALSSARVLVAGCGSTGGSAVEPLVRLGVQRLVLADPGEYELNNLNRQDAGLDDLGRNKAEAAQRRALAINPHTEVRVHTEGVVAQTMSALIEGVDVVLDGVDVTTPAGWEGKFRLHQAAVDRGLPVISGYDMSGTQYIRYYDYRLPSSAPLDGAVTETHLNETGVWDLLSRVVPRDVVPGDLIEDIRAHRADPDYSVPQLVYTSMLFGALAAHYVVEILAGNPVRETVCVDLHTLVRP